MKTRRTRSECFQSSMWMCTDTPMVVDIELSICSSRIIIKLSCRIFPGDPEMGKLFNFSNNITVIYVNFDDLDKS